MGLAVFSFMNIAFALGTKDPQHSVFSEDTLADRTLMLATIVGVLITFAASQLGMLQRILDTVALTFEQWVVCILVGFSVLLISEVRKLLWKIPADEVDITA
jgi:Ca2+-transporting ATPase